jgi:TonB dependent receptor-like, beta-barrel
MPTSSWALRTGWPGGVNTGTWGHRKNIVGAYFQDDWRATDTLTLNLGVRWEYHTPLYEVKDRQSNFEPFTGKLLLAGQDGNSRALYNGYWKDFQPRVGFAWTPSFLEGGKTVLRGAYTISSFMEGTGTNLRLPLNPPFNVEFETLYDKGDALLIPQSNISQGLTVLQALDPFKGVNIRLWDPNVRPANVQQWSLIVERQLP